MESFTVTISERPLGVRFGHFSSKQSMIAGLHQVLIGSHGHRLGLLAGDTLIAVNNVSVSQLTSSDALHIFRTQSLPFSATFNRPKTNSNTNHYPLTTKNPTPAISPSESTPKPTPNDTDTFAIVCENENQSETTTAWMSYLNP